MDTNASSNHCLEWDRVDRRGGTCSRRAQAVTALDGMFSDDDTSEEESERVSSSVDDDDDEE